MRHHIHIQGAYCEVLNELLAEVVVYAVHLLLLQVPAQGCAELLQQVLC